MSTYSFTDVTATLAGSGGSINMGHGSAAAEEGITLSMTDDRNDMRIGADGEGMHSLRANKSGTVTVRLLKTSPVNAQLAAVYNEQSLLSHLWGTNVIVVRHVHSGDTWTARKCAFVKMPDFNYAQDGDTVEWEFHAVKIDPVLGTY